jgi:hypothetical protein
VLAAPPNSNKSSEARSEQRDGRRFGYGGHKFGDHHFAVAGAEIGDQDRVEARVEGAPPTARPNPAESTADSGATPAIAPTAAGAAGETPTRPTAAKPTVAVGFEGVDTASETGKCLAAAGEEGATDDGVGAGTEKAPAPAPAKPAGSTAVSTHTAAWTTAIRTGEATLPGKAGANKSTTPATTARDHQPRVAGTDHKTAAAATAGPVTGPGTTRASHYDLQDLARSQVEIAADLGASATGTNAAGKGAAASLRAKGEDLIGVGGRDRESDGAPTIGEVEQRSAGGRFRGGDRQERRPTQQKQFHFCLPDMRYAPKSMPVSTLVPHYGVVVKERK